MATGKMATETLNPPDIFARGSREMTVDQHKFADGWFLQTSDSIAEEVPVALVFNGISHAVMMATPLDLEDFAIGFSLAERIVDQPSQIYDIVVVSNTAILGIELQIQIASECFVRLKNKRRSLSGKTGCGLCGLESLQSLDLATPRLNADHRVSKAALAKAFGQLSSKQVLNAATGSMHAAAWADLDGDILCVREDVGRHNALDKLIGGLRCERGEVPIFVILSRECIGSRFRDHEQSCQLRVVAEIGACGHQHTGDDFCPDQLSHQHGGISRYLSDRFCPRTWLCCVHPSATPASWKCMRLLHCKTVLSCYGSSSSDSCY
jgi:formate dehydrogenase accessory protein FdhD